MGRPGISYEDVLQAASTLLSDGQSPTVQRVREQLGRGSHSTIATHLRRFHTEQLGDETATYPPPPAAFQSACGQLWQQAMDLAADSFSAERDTLETRMHSVLADREDLLRRHQWSRATLAQRDAELQAQRVECQTLQQSLEAQCRQQQTLSHQLSQARSALQTEQRRAADTESALHAAQQRTEKDAARLEQLLRGQLDDERQRGEEAQRLLMLEMDRLRSALAGAQKAHQQGREQARDELRSWQRDWQQERDVLRAEQMSLQTQLETQLQALERISRERDTLQLAMENARRVIVQLRQRLARRSGAATAPRSDILDSGPTGGMDRH